MNKTKRYVLFPVALAVGIASFITQMVVTAEEPCKKDDVPPQVMCYQVASPPPKIDTIDDLKLQLEKLEEQYKNQKITEETYKTRKQELQNKIEDLEE